MFKRRKPLEEHNSDSKKAFGIISKYMEKDGLSRDALAAELGIGHYLIDQWATGSRGWTNHLQELKTTLDISDRDYKILLRITHPAFDDKWLESQPENKRAGFFLSALRARAQLNQADIEKQLKFPEGTWNSWEKGASNTFVHHLDKISGALHITSSEKQRLLQLSLPAYDDKWLAQQPIKKQAGLLLEAYCYKKNILQDTIAKRLHEIDLLFQNDQRSVTPLFTGYRNLTPYLRDLKTAVNLTDEEYKKLSYLAMPSLNPEYIQELPQIYQAGEYLRALRLRANLSTQEFADELSEIVGKKIGRSTVANWESALGFTFEDHLKDINTILGLSKEESAYLKQLTYSSRTAERPAARYESTTPSCHARPKS